MTSVLEDYLNGIADMLYISFEKYGKIVKLAINQEISMDIQLIDDGEEILCNQFYNRIYKRNRTIDQWRWEFAQNNYKSSPIPYARVMDESQVVGTQAFIPIRMIDIDGVFWTAKSEETLVDPDYRGRQLFEKMYNFLFDYARTNQFACIWGFTPAIKAFKRLDFSFPGKVDQIFIPFQNKSISLLLKKEDRSENVNFKNKLKRAVFLIAGLVAQGISMVRLNLNKNSPLAGLAIKRWDKPDEQCGELCKQFIQQWGGTTIYRDAEYMQWRFFDNPYVKCIVKGVYDQDRLLGWVAYNIGDDGMGYLIDLILIRADYTVAPKEIIKQLLIEAAIGCRNMGASGIRGWHANNHPFDKLICEAARDVGYYHIRKGHETVIYFCETGKVRNGYTNFDNWFVTRINTEGVHG